MRFSCVVCLGQKKTRWIAPSRLLLAGRLGFEPRLAESESAVLPLDDPPAGGVASRATGWFAPVRRERRTFYHRKPGLQSKKMQYRHKRAKPLWGNDIFLGGGDGGGVTLAGRGDLAIPGDTQK